MDDRSGTGPGPSEFAGADQDDPFAELAKLIEAPWGEPISRPAAKVNTVAERLAPASEPDPEFEAFAENAPLEGIATESDAPSEDLRIGETVDVLDASDADIDLEEEEPSVANDVASPIEAAAAKETAVFPASADMAFELKPSFDDFSSTKDSSVAEAAAQQAANLVVDHFGLDSAIASELDVELADFAKDIGANGSADVVEAPAEPVEPAKPRARPHFGAAIFGQHKSGAIAKTETTSPVTVSDPVLEPLAVDKSDTAGKGDDGFDVEFAMALEGLSAPADPLAGKVRKTEAFAPERRAEEEKVESVFDDFDSLLASEIATLNLDKAPSQAIEDTPAPEASDSASESAADSDDIEREPLPRILSTFSESAPSGSRVAASPVRSFRSLPFQKLAAGIVGLAMLGGAGMLVFGGSGDEDGAAEPLIVKADAEPVKIAPPDPGGKQVANQNRATYEKVANADADGKTQQEALISASEKPIDLSQKAPESYENLPGVQSSAFAIAMSDSKPASAEPTLQPRRVKTVTVLPDGTIVANKETESLEPRSALIDAAARPLEGRQTIGGIATPASAEQATLAGSADLAAIEAMANASATNSSDEMVMTGNSEIVGEPAPDVPVPSMKPKAPERRVASLEPVVPPSAPAVDTNAATGESDSASSSASAPGPDIWYVQMSSQPNAEAAQASAQTVASKYSSIVSDRKVMIQAAEIPGKGTYHRVRLAASSRQEAINLCEQMKSAGGSCYVAR
ncbi:SOLUBLE LYTIC MUREIN TRANSGLYCOSYLASE [Fulvimarina pelagi HTCC2506]|uniref:SOLUBLE LYTIC MUREIN TRANSGLYCOSYLASE n=2 Tax=Fulvimarina pelagi TaxID=217511 RepID=Q0FZP6_9HYPH|nr:SPOR domain-containing protein [Fulvimarina pelagi]EAU40545.1 SOLUBLE LYTIC MUREIN TRANSGLYCOSYLASE [Fulvimarina pelagi HTCC2506]BAT31568.1 soluble lytic murein transglycosylase [Fulvimarina pelagi]